MRWFLATCYVLALMGPALAQELPNGLSPNAKLTPGAADPTLTTKVICAKGWHTGLVRDVDDTTKRKVLAAYGLASDHASYCAKAGCEVDHLIPIEVGGSNDAKNLWPEPYGGIANNAHVKDVLENKLHELVCAGTLSQATAQHDIAVNWVAAFAKYVH